MPYMYFVSMAIYFIIHVISVVMLIRHGILKKSSVETDEEYLWFWIVIGLISSCVWPVAAVVAMMLLLGMSLSKFLVKFVKKV